MAALSIEDYATPTQLQYLEAVKTHGSARAAERALGLANDTIGQSLRRLRKYSALKGVAPDHDLKTPVPDPFMVKGVSTYYSVDPITGERVARGQWVKTALDADALEEMRRAVIAGMNDEISLAEPVAPPVYADDDLLTIYPQGDPHAGLYAWEEETGARFDLAEFERVQCAAIDRLVASAPPSATAIFNDKGDSTHADNSKNRTPRSGHELDVDGRHAQVVRVAIRVKRYQIARMLEKHRKVILRIDPGNHDPETALMMALVMEASYANEPRVEVITSPNPFWFYEFGKVLIGTVHGDGAKGADLPLVMATDAREAWGRVAFCVWFVGHVHHKHIKDYTGVTVEYVRTLAASDAHHHGQGYRSPRSMEAVTYHREDLEVERHTCSLQRLNRLAA